jgi:hypothetical protein
MTITRNLSILAPGVSSSGVVAVANGGTGLSVAVLNYISGLTLSTAGSSATFGIAVGAAADSTNASLMYLSSAYTKTTSAWAVGSGNGSLDTGAIAASTWYFVWLIQRPDTGVVDVLISLSATSPTLPTNYTLKRRIGAMYSNSSSQWRSFRQLGDYFFWTLPVMDINYYPVPTTLTGVGTSSTNTNGSTPLGLACLTYMNLYAQTVSGAGSILLSSEFETTSSSGTSYTSSVVLAGTGQAAKVYIVPTTAGYFNVVAESAGNHLLRGYVQHWVDPRGR